ncbi:STAS domain-containing protein [Nodularia harveyana UHCC-0300]|uniref:Anti-sigma factor antagonist n=1 Tax=Nodularia harveyana UHCC-0300 TaxID=2974287 RepID=A0ABU5UCK3_9CYAN|nr:STAS domain-containing protein [Nodularia harveyana]MEA5581098.1 STAS domain-containing protein [Nodularia harveyana UHCC-0300]
MNQAVKIVKLSGIINTTNSEELRQHLTDIKEAGTKTILVDCEDISFMDSSALGALVLAFKTLRAADIRLVLCSINEQVRILFELTGMDKVFEIFADQEQFHQTLLSKK